VAAIVIPDADGYTLSVWRGFDVVDAEMPHGVRVERAA
jgi:hypothetical protein